MCSKKIQKNVQKDTLKRFTDKKFSRFFWSFFGSRKAEKIREKFPGGKKILEKITGFSPEKNQRNLLEKLQEKKILSIFLHFSLFFWTTKKEPEKFTNFFLAII